MNNMKLLIIFINLICCYITASSAASFSGNFTDPDYPGKCVLKKEHLILSAGENAPEPEYCGIIKCGENGFVQKYSCLAPYIPDGCKLREPIDPASTYPDCCTTVICNDKGND